MPGYPWMANVPANAADIEAKMRALRHVGVPYTEEEIKGAGAELRGKSEMDALIAYLQGLGTALKSKAN
jgi:cytochrome c oxidase cbb3-type subunit 2